VGREGVAFDDTRAHPRGSKSTCFSNKGENRKSMWRDGICNISGLGCLSVAGKNAWCGIEVVRARESRGDEDLGSGKREAGARSRGSGPKIPNRC
jgi:hypothetical protein